MTILDRLLGRPVAPMPKTAKAVTALGAWGNAIPLSSMQRTPQQKAQAYLRAYNVGWFSKAGRKIAGDVSSLDWSLSLGDAEEGDAEQTLERPDLMLPFETLSPIDQFQRLLERPNPTTKTGRALLHKTNIHLDFTGNACWFLEGGTGGGLPSALYPINPGRMTPSRDKAGTLIGWVMDEGSTNPVPFDVDEILWFSTGGPDDDVWGTSVVECVYSQVPLTDQMARHTSNVLTTGGRLAGMMWPKERALSEDEFLDAQRAWRNVASDPDAGKRLLIFPEPMEYATGASTPAEIGIPELATLNRDEILTAFPISPYMLGVPTPGGLNSGEVRREDRRDYWEGTIHPRADLIEETVQVGLLSRYENATGQTYDYELAEPNMDDAESLVGKAAAFKDLVGIGLDPEESLKVVGLSHIKWTGLPAILDPAQQQMMAQQRVEAMAQAPDEEPPQPATKARAEDARDRVSKPAIEQGKRELRRFFDEQRERVTSNLRASLPAAKAQRRAFAKADPSWWDSDLEDRELERTIRSLYVTIGRGALQVAADDLGRFIFKNSADPIVADLLANGGARIKDINERTLQALTIELAEGTRRGYSLPQLIEGVPEHDYRGVLGVTLENGTPVFGDLRAETIARTETALSYNRASVLGYSELGVQEFLAYDGDEDEVCAERNGQTFSTEEALAIEDHPNGTLVFSPLVGEEKALDMRNEPTVTIPAISITPHIDVHMPEQPAPSVTINVEPTPIINEVTSATPLVIDKTTKAAPAIQDVRIVESMLPPRKRVVKRDGRGNIAEVSEE